METANFTDLQEEFMHRVGEAVYCVMATVDRQNRPRTRLLHPIWAGPMGWVSRGRSRIRPNIWPIIRTCRWPIGMTRRSQSISKR